MKQIIASFLRPPLRRKKRPIPVTANRRFEQNEKLSNTKSLIFACGNLKVIYVKDVLFLFLFLVFRAVQTAGGWSGSSQVSNMQSSCLPDVPHRATQMLGHVYKSGNRAMECKHIFDGAAVLDAQSSLP